MRARNRLAAVAAACSLALLPALGLPSAAGAAKRVKAPKDGKYTGHAGGTRTVTVYVSGKAIQLVAFQFKCGTTTGSTSISDIKLKKSRKGYRFSITAYGIVSYADEHPDENGRTAISGVFSRKTARSVKGVLSVRTPRCGRTAAVKWSAHR